MAEREELPPVEKWIEAQNFTTTKEIPVPPLLSDQVIGQDEAVDVVKKAAIQKRHVLLIGEPGTGKSMLARSMVDFLPREELEDVLVYHNQADPNEPLIRTVPAGKGKEIVQHAKREAEEKKAQRGLFFILIIAVVILVAVFLSFKTTTVYDNATGTSRTEWSFDPIVLFAGIVAVAMLIIALRLVTPRSENIHIPKLLVSHSPTDKPPFIDATGAHAGALLGDVRHDPFQSGGLETPPHERVEAGAIHKAHKGVLFIDEINMLRMESQHSLLSAMQEKKFSIVGQSERSAGALVKTEPVPCDFVLVAAGNVDAIQGMHPALRSRIRGYGYEVYMNNVMPDTDENRKKLIRFVAQEVLKDGKIPHFDKSAVCEIIREAQRRAGRKGQLTLRLRELGGLIRVAGDIAKAEDAPVVTAKHVLQAKAKAKSVEQQIADKYLEKKREYKTFKVSGSAVGVVNGLAAIGADISMAEYSGVVLPIVAEVTPAHTKYGGKIIATGKLGEIAKEAVQNVAALIKKYTGEDISNHDIHIQFIGTYEGVEGDSASVSVATAVISALAGVEVMQDVAMTGSLDVRGNVLPVGGITAKIEAAAEAGIKKVIIPKENLKDVLIDDKYKDRVEIIPAATLGDVLKASLVGPRKESLLKKLMSYVSETPLTPITQPKENLNRGV
ncbi:MAG: ATP-dependent protease LonB [Thermoplasmata archaeon]